MVVISSIIAVTVFGVAVATLIGLTANEIRLYRNEVEEEKKTGVKRQKVDFLSYQSPYIHYGI